MAVEKNWHKPRDKADDKFSGDFHARYRPLATSLVDRNHMFSTGPGQWGKPLLDADRRRFA